MITNPLIFPKVSVTTLQKLMDEIFELFPDHYPVLEEEDENYWKFKLEWPSNKEWYVDEELEMNALQQYRIQLHDLPQYCEIYDWGNIDFIFSMFHSRSLIAASRTIARMQGKPLTWIVHVDDHTDLMDTILEPTGTEGILYDNIFQQTLRMDQPLSIESAIDRGVINKGNFLSAYVLAYNSNRLIHIHSSIEDSTSWLLPEEQEFNFAGRYFNGSGITSQKYEHSGAWQFQQISQLPLDLPLSNQDSVWLDIDLDAFCNRYDGDSDRRQFFETAEEKNRTVEEINLFLNHLSNASWLNYVKTVSIAASPGFFPSSYWSYSIPTIIDKVRNVLVG